MKITIRRPISTDQPADVAALYYRVWQTAYRDILPARFLKALSVASWHPEKRWSNTLLAVDEQSTISGVCTFGPNRNDDYPNTSEIYSLYVDDGCRGRGIGHDLLNQAIGMLPDDKDCFVVVLTENRSARRFYTRMGFKQNGESETSVTKYGPINEVTLVRNGTNS